MSGDRPAHCRLLVRFEPREPSIAIWRRGRREPEGFGDFNLSPRDVVHQASSAGRQCHLLVDAFAESRLRIFDALELDEAGEVVRLLLTHIPWTHWLRPADLTPAQWQLIGAGPNLNWITDADGERSRWTTPAALLAMLGPVATDPERDGVSRDLRSAG